MSSKTFEGVDGTRLLHIKNLGKHVAMSIEVPGQVHMGITFDPASIPALALAELEAAGFEDSSSGGRITGARIAVGDLRRHVANLERAAADAKEQAELEAEALELANSAVLVVGNPPYPSIGHMSDTSLRKWLAVARKARAMAKEATNGR